MKNEKKKNKKKFLCLNIFFIVPDDLHSARRLVDDADVLSTLERSFRLIHEPTKPLIGTDLPSNSVPGSASSLRLSIRSYLARFMKRSVFEKIKLRQTRLDHNLFDVIWPAMKKAKLMQQQDNGSDVGIVFPDFDVFVVFQEFLVPLIKDVHCIDINADFHPQPDLQYYPPKMDSAQSSDSLSSNVFNINLDRSGKWIIAGVVECLRNLENFELPLNMNIGQLEMAERILIERLLTAEFAKTIDEKVAGTYYTMNEIIDSNSEIRAVLATRGLLIPLLDRSDPYQATECVALHGQHWPYGRGVYVSHQANFVAWVNCQDHLRVLCCTASDAPANIGAAYNIVGKAMTYLNGKIFFRNSYFLGYLTSRPSFLGTSLRLTLSLQLPNLMKEEANLQHLCTVRGIHMTTHKEMNCIRVSNMQGLGITEWQLLHDFCTAVTNVIQLEKDITMESSGHIAQMLVNIFKKKRNSLIDNN